MSDAFTVFSLPLTASLEDIKKRFKQLALLHHSDKNRSSLEFAHLKFIKIRVAYEDFDDTF